MINYKQPGDVLTFTAPSGGVLSSKGYLIGALFVIAAGDALETVEFEGQITGVFSLPKVTGTAWTEGQLLYWDDSAKKVTTVAGGNTLIGSAAGLAGALSAAAVGNVRLNGTAGDDAVGVTSAQAAVFFSGEITATGSAQNVAHGLGVVPAGVMPAITEHPGTPDTGAFDYAPGTHTTTNIVFTATVNTKWRFFAWA